MQGYDSDNTCAIMAMQISKKKFKANDVDGANICFINGCSMGIDF